ncbi:hypothetical protein GCM10022393_24690 [Aquimarina addita]|uniref:Choice-of-anchor A family protein n=1 Tax=Aquimarina addita TaxID=870485 RepID=A0ABP6UPE9_9FLAO
MFKTTTKTMILTQKPDRQNVLSIAFGCALILLFLITSGFNTVDEESNDSATIDPTCENPLADALGYNAFVRYAAYLGGGDTEGPIALGGDLTMNGIITVAAQTPGINFFNGDDKASSLVVNGKVQYVSGQGIQLNQGYAKIGNLNGSSIFDKDLNNASVNTRATAGGYGDMPRIQVHTQQDADSVAQGDLIDFEAAFAGFNALSLAYSSLAPNVVLSDDYKVTLIQNEINVLNVTGAELKSLPYVTFTNTPSKETPLVINVDASGDLEWDIFNIAGIGDQQGSFIIWNFFNSSSITLTGGGTIIGAVLAPAADVIKDSSGNINGQVIAANYFHNEGELHQHVFDSCIDIEEGKCELAVDAGDDVEFCGEGEATLTATVSGASECVDCLGVYGVENTDFCTQNKQYVMWFEGGRFFSNIDLEWTELTNGSATLIGTVYDAANPQDTYEVNALFTGKTINAPVDSPKEHSCNDEATNDWVYYTGLSGSVTATDGSWSVNVSRRGPAFQIGNGANVSEKETGKYGACGWFDATGSDTIVGDFNFNPGACVSTTSTTEVSYLWSTGETTPSITVTEEGMYTVTVTDCESCEATDTVEVILNDAANVDAGDDQAICLGEEVTLTAQVDNEEGCVDCTEYQVEGTDYCSGNHDFVIWLTNQDRTDKRWYSNVDLVWEEFENGTAKLTGTVLDYTVTNETYEVDVTYSGKTTTPPTDSPKTHNCNDEDTTGWTYYPEMSGTITKTDGSEVMEITRRGEAFQVGNGANVFETAVGKNGASGWLNVTDNYFAYGDININFGDCIDQDAKSIEYLWSTGETTQSITVSPTQETVYTVTATNCVGCVDEDSVTVSVNTASADAGDDQTITAGEVVVLTATGGTSFEWSTGETTASIEVSPTETTTYSVQVSDNGCQATDDVTVFVEGCTTSVDAGVDQTICEGDIVTLTAIGDGAFMWSTGETTASIEVSPYETTTYSVSIMNGDCVASDEVLVTVNYIEVDAGRDRIICPEEESRTERMSILEDIVLTASIADSYLWSTGETTQSITVSPGVTTTYTVTATIGDCSATDDVVVYVDEGCSEDEDSSAFSLTVYPTLLTPTDEVTLDFYANKDQNVTVSIHNLSGKSVGPAVSNKVIEGDTMVAYDLKKIGGLAQGIYLIRVQTADEVKTKKIIIK